MWLFLRYTQLLLYSLRSFTLVLYICIVFSNLSPAAGLRKYSRKDVVKLREEVREMFQHAYNGYLNHASDYDELRPLTVTCTAGVGTFIVEFGALSRLTGDPIYEEVALNAINSLRKYMSNIGLYGNHIDVQTGRWTGVDSGIGAGIDSYFEYLAKGSIMLSQPELSA